MLAVLHAAIAVAETNTPTSTLVLKYTLGFLHPSVSQTLYGFVFKTYLTFIYYINIDANFIDPKEVFHEDYHNFFVRVSGAM